LTIHQGGIRSLNVVDLTGNLGGGTRFVRALLPALRRARPELAISLYGSPTSVNRHSTSGLTEAGINVRSLTLLDGATWNTQPFGRRARYRFRRLARLEPGREEYARRVFEREIDGADLLYFPWPYFLDAPRVRAPMVTTIHDLNFRYFFGTPIFGASQTATLERQIAKWITSATTIASSQFMAEEIGRFYPEAGTPPVSGLAPFSHVGEAPSETLDLGTGVRRPFVLSANNVTVHKNLGGVIAAQAILRDRNPDLHLVMAGVGTERATGRATSVGSTSPIGDPDVIGLGYVSNEHILRLIDEAEVVVNASLYEAGNGPGLDAWSRGAPVAMSDIPAFTEHLSALGVEATLFNPRDPADIAAKIQAVLDDPATARAAAERSRVAINKHTWDVVAVRYLEVFDTAFARRTHG